MDLPIEWPFQSLKTAQFQWFRQLQSTEHGGLINLVLILVVPMLTPSYDTILY